MDSNSIASDLTSGHVRGALGDKVRALIWEECRVAGVIAGWCLCFGLLGIAETRWVFGDAVWSHNTEFVLPVVLGMPILTALLLILNPDNSGHLIGGFSRRVLWLPVPTSAAVAVALLTRTLFVFVTMGITVTASDLFYTGGPGFGWVIAVTMFYLAAQTLDWLRAPVSGLTSVLGVVFVGGIVLSFGANIELSEAIRDSELVTGPSFEVFPLLLATAAVAYGVSLVGVSRTRMGKRVGVPEIWEWPRLISAGMPGRVRPFASHFAAQVWFEFRRSGWMFPVVAVALWVLAVGALWISDDPGKGVPHRVDAADQRLRLFAAAMAFIALFLAAAFHGLRARGLGFLGFRRSGGRAGFDYLQPFTASEGALARCTVNAALLLPMLIVATAAGFAMAAPTFTTEIVPTAFAMGAVKVREVVWVYAGRVVLGILIAWPLMAISTRLISFLSGLIPILGIVAVVLADLAGESRYAWVVAGTLCSMAVLAVVLVAYANGIQRGIVPYRAAAVWAIAWLLTTWLLNSTIWQSARYIQEDMPWRMHGLVVCLGLAALIPLPYIALALDIHRRRHSASPEQDRLQHKIAGGLFGGRRLAWFGVAVVFTIFVLWLGAPNTPGFERFWRAKSYPTSLNELNAWYPEVDPSANRALEYLNLFRQQQTLAGSYWSRAIQADLPLTDESREVLALVPLAAGSDRREVLIVNKGQVVRDEPIADHVWKASDEYWREVTAKVMPELKRIAAAPVASSRYPVDFRAGFATLLEHLAPIRSLAREASLDALHATIEGQPTQAVDAVATIPPLANSLANEPILISQLVRIAVLSIAEDASQNVLNRSVLAEPDLARLQQILEAAVPPEVEGLMFERALAGEATMGLVAVGSPGMVPYYEGFVEAPGGGLGAIVWQLAVPAAAERMVLAPYFVRMIAAGREPWTALNKTADELDERFFVDNRGIAPLATILAPALSRAWEAEWRVRMQLTIAATAIAVERYRLATGSLPLDLEVLVPQYLATMPEDYFADRSPIKYRAKADNEFVVYSVGRDSQDDGGEEMKNWNYDGDITFTIAPLSFRSGPQIASASTTPAEPTALR